MLRIIALAAFSVVVFAATFAQADPWIGQKIYWRDGARLMLGDNEVGWDRVPAPAVVQKVDNHWLWIGQAWLRESDALTVDQKLDLDSEAIRRQPRSASLWANRGNEYNEKGQFDDAIRDFNQAIELDPRLERAWLQRGVAWQGKGQYANALKEYSEAIRLAPNSPFVWNSSAWLRATCPDEQFRDGAKAVKNATKACELANWKGAGWIDTLAAAYAEQGDFDAAVEWATKATTLEPATTEFQDHLALFQSHKPLREAAK